MDAQRWRLLTAATAAVTATAVGLAPLVSFSSCSTTSTGSSSCTSGRQSLLTAEGTSVLFVLAVPVVIALVPVVARSRPASAVAAALLTIATMLGAMSIGIAFVPTVVLAWVAVGAAERTEVRAR